jgi:hypothetical protein
MAKKKSDVIYEKIIKRCIGDNGIPVFDDMWRKGIMDTIARAIAETMTEELEKLHKKIRKLNKK